MKKFVLCRKGIIKGTALILTMGALGGLFGCNTAEAAEITPSEASTATATFKPTPEPTATPKPTDTPIPELPMEEEIKLLALKNPEIMVALNTLSFMYFTTLDENNEEVPHVSFVQFSDRMEGNKQVWDIYDMFTKKLLCTCTSSEKIKYLSEIGDLEPDTSIENLKTIDIKMISPFVAQNLDYLEKNFGIKLNFTEWLCSVSELSDSGLANYELSAYEYAQHYIEMVPKEYRTTAAMFDDSLNIGPTISPTRFAFQNPSISYLTGKRDIDTEMAAKNKVRGM